MDIDLSQYLAGQQALSIHTSLVKKSSATAFSSHSECSFLGIKDELNSKSAVLLFTENGVTRERFVIKILRTYEDARYRLKTIGERQECQLEALRWNKKFTPNVYIGLVPIYQHALSHNSICIDKVIENPIKEMFDPRLDYGLSMQELPGERRLDTLLKEGNQNDLGQLLRFLAQYVAHMHSELVEPIALTTWNLQWGSFQQVRSKLAHNLALIEVALTANENGSFSPSQWMTNNLSNLLPRNWYRRYVKHHKKPIHTIFDREKLAAIFEPLKYNLPYVLRQNPYEEYFKKRIEKDRIKHCHGDLKTPHIWIESFNNLPDSSYRGQVSILDAIDFNPTYSNIDILSDFAMLLIDVQVRTHSQGLTDFLREEYLTLTGQTDSFSRAVLNYYIVEKAIMWAAISIFFDNAPELGYAFLEVATKHINSLVWRDIFRRNLMYKALTLQMPTILSSSSQSK